mgnify:CR=1 FL=1
MKKLIIGFVLVLSFPIFASEQILFSEFKHQIKTGITSDVSICYLKLELGGSNKRGNEDFWKDKVYVNLRCGENFHYNGRIYTIRPDSIDKDSRPGEAYFVTSIAEELNEKGLKITTCPSFRECFFSN